MEIRTRKRRENKKHQDCLSVCVLCACTQSLKFACNACFLSYQDWITHVQTMTKHAREYKQYKRERERERDL